MIQLNYKFMRLLLILCLLFVSSISVHASQNSEVVSHESYFEHQIQDESLSEPKTQDELDYQAIYSYIGQINKNVSSEEAAKIAQCLVDYGKQQQIDPKFAAAVISHESQFNRRAVSRTGAKGLGQIKDMNFPHLKISDPFDIEQNISGTITYLKQMMSHWKERQDQLSLALASYYKGPGAMKRSEGQMDSATRRYVSDVLASYDRLHQIQDKLDYNKTTSSSTILGIFFIRCRLFAKE